MLAAIAFSVYYMYYSPVEVKVYRVVRASIVNEVMGPGTLDARVRAQVSPKISGLLTELKTDQDDQIFKVVHFRGTRLVKVEF